jgi:translocator protein
MTESLKLERTGVRKNRLSVPKLLLSILVCEAVGVIGSLFTLGSISTWYASIQKPWFTPPNWVFGPVWITLFLLMGISLYLIWSSSKRNSTRKAALIFFVVQLALNLLWTILFFGQQFYFLGFAEILVLWGAIALTIATSLRVSKIAGYVLVPYISWVTIATLLNYYVWILNH